MTYIDPERFDELSAICERMTGRPWDGTTDHLAEASCRQSETTEVLNRYIEWLDTLRDRAAAHGRPWTTREARRQSRLDGDLTVVPEWIVDEAAR